MNTVLSKDPKAVFGLCLKRCNLRKERGNVPLYANDGTDQNQISAVLPLSCVRLLNKWDHYYYIKYNGQSGWVEEKYVFPISRTTAEKIVFAKNFCVVTQPEISITGEKYYMSCKIPMENNLMKIPFAAGDVVKFKELPVCEGCHIGYLPFSRQEIISQAVKYLNTPYDWGGEKGGVDCSSLISHVFSCFGYYLPPSSKEQSKVVFPVMSYSVDEIEKADIGDIIYSPGHVRLSLGGGYFIHASFTAGKVCIGST